MVEIDEGPYSEGEELPGELLEAIASRVIPADLFKTRSAKCTTILDGFEFEICTTVRLKRRYHAIGITLFEGEDLMGKQISLLPGEVKQIEVHGFTADGTDVGIVNATITGSDNHTIQVSDQGNGYGTITAVGRGGSSADILATDDSGNSDTVHG